MWILAGPCFLLWFSSSNAASGMHKFQVDGHARNGGWDVEAVEERVKGVKGWVIVATGLLLFLGCTNAGNLGVDHGSMD